MILPVWQIKDIIVARLEVRGWPASMQKQQIPADSKVNKIPETAAIYCC